MGIFRRNQVDLSDEGLALAAEESNVNEAAAADESFDSAAISQQLVDAGEEAAAEPANATEAFADNQPGAEADGAQALSAAAKAERESLWQAAAAEIAASWPQAMGEGQALIAKMVEISERYGDRDLWQRTPSGIMREAAIELFGLPTTRDNEYAKMAAQSARAAAMEEMNRRNNAKAGLSKRRGRQNRPPVLTEEEKIIEEIANARSRGIF